MPPDPPPLWTLRDFGDCLDAWTATERPPADLLIAINAWGLSLLEDPYRNAVRAEGLGGDIWFATIPGTFDGCHVVTLTFFVDALQHEVRCSYFGYVAPPVGR